MLERVQTPEGLVIYRSRLLARHGLPHAFSTRVRVEGESESVLRERLTRTAGLAGAPVVTVKQVHGAHAIRIGAGALPDPALEADALVSERAGVFVGVHVADCVPVLLASADGRRVAAVHAGWRGIVAGVIPRALAELGQGPVLAAIGPCISRERFEVGPEVVSAFANAGLGAVVHARPGARPHIDLRAAAAEQLAAGGVERIETTDRCTYEHAGEFFSYRRDVTHGSQARTGRLSAWIAPRPS
jgi:YfiH family protein